MNRRGFKVTTHKFITRYGHPNNGNPLIELLESHN